MVTAVILAAAIMITAANLNLEKLFLSRKRMKMVQRLITLPVTWLVVYVTDTVRRHYMKGADRELIMSVLYLTATQKYLQQETVYTS